MTLDRRLFVYAPPPLIAIALLVGAAMLESIFPEIRILHGINGGGYVWMASGIALSISSAVQFHKIGTTALPFGTPSQLITLGAYLWTRNPMYLGILTTLIGVAIYKGTLFFFLVPWLFFLLINQIHIPYEEAKLHETFGSAYDRYLQRVRRWL